MTIASDQLARERVGEDVRPRSVRPAATARRYHPLWQIVVTRIKEFYRHPSSIFWVYVFPILMAVVLGVAFQNPTARVYPVDIESGPAAERIAAALRAASKDDQGMVFAPKIVSRAAANRDLKTTRTMLVVVPSGAAGETQSESAPLDQIRIDYRYDATRPESVDARRTVDDALQRAAGRRDAIAVREQRFSEPGGRYIDFLVPGLIGAGLMSGGMWGCGFVVVDLRVRNLLKRLITTPMRRSDFLAGLMLSRFFFMVTEVVLMLFLSWLFFNVRILGSWVALALFIVLGAMTFAAMGLVVASRAQTLETASGLINLVMLPMWLVSGIFFPIDRFPEVVLPLIKLLPLTALIDAARGIMIEGETLAGLWSPFLVLAVWTAACFAIALRYFRWY
jgi:ABC-2 type transport system permease protein